ARRRGSRPAHRPADRRPAGVLRRARLRAATGVLVARRRALARQRGQPVSVTPYPKIELHVHLEGTVRAHTLLQIAKRNDYALPADTVEGLAALYEFTDFRHFIDVWILTTNALKKEADYRQMVVDYAAEAAAHGAVYLEGI